MVLPDYGLACGAISITGIPDTIRNLDHQESWRKPMVKYYSDGVVIKDTREAAELPPAIQKLLLDGWARYLARERARDDAKGAVKGFIAICVLVAIAVSFLISF